MARLGDAFVLIRNGASIKQTEGAGGIPITRIETIANREVDRNKFGYAGIPDIHKYSDYVLQDEDILMSHINSEKHLGKAAIYKKIGNEIIIHGMNLLVLRANPEIVCSKYALYYFETPFFRQQIIKITKKSVNQASFTITALKDVEIPLPSLKIQKYVASTLDRLSELVSLRKQQLAKLDELVRARFVEMFGDPLEDRNRWERVKWNKVFTTTTGKLDSNAAVSGGKYPFFTCAKEWLWIDTYAFDCAALLLAGNNAAGIYDVKYYKGKFNAYQRTYVLTLLNPDWRYPLFKYQLESRLNYLQSQSKGTNTRYLTLGILQALDFIVPPPELQNEFSIFDIKINQQKVMVQQSVEQLELLKKSLMQEYFG